MHFCLLSKSSLFSRPISKSLLNTSLLAYSCRYPIRTFHNCHTVKMPNKHNHKNPENSDAEHKHIDRRHSKQADEAHQFQAGTSTDRKEDEWKHREPYQIHKDDENFDVKWKGKCHCGKVQYQLSREKPLASKFCHCTTCQRLHGVGVKSLLQPLLIYTSHHSNGQRSSTNQTSTSLMAFMILAGMIQQTRTILITCHARFNVHSVEHLLWMKAET